MIDFLLVLIGVAICYVIVRVLHKRQRDPKENPDAFICPHCNERHCTCHRPGEAE